jgi:hypothetical protein
MTYQNSIPAYNCLQEGIKNILRGIGNSLDKLFSNATVLSIIIDNLNIWLE